MFVIFLTQSNLILKTHLISQNLVKESEIILNILPESAILTLKIDAGLGFLNLLAIKKYLSIKRATRNNDVDDLLTDLGYGVVILLRKRGL